jgi:hypothetical protein
MVPLSVLLVAAGAVTILLSAEAFQTTPRLTQRRPLFVTNELETSTAVQQQLYRTSASLTQEVITKLRFRELHRELAARQLPTTGTTSALRERLREDLSCIVSEDGIEDDCVPVRTITCSLQCI